MVYVVVVVVVGVVGGKELDPWGGSVVVKYGFDVGPNVDNTEVV